MQQYKRGDTFPIEVLRVIDGDTLEVLVLGTSDFSHPNTLSVLLCGIDAPEMTQRYGEEAKSYLESLVSDGRFWMRVVGEEQGNYAPAMVVCDVCRNSPDESLSKAMVKSGWAYWRRDWDTDELGLEKLEQEAFFAALGVWQGDGNEVRPWDHRRMVWKEDEGRIKRYDAECRRKRRNAAFRIMLLLVLCTIGLAVVNVKLAGLVFFLVAVPAVSHIIASIFLRSTTSNGLELLLMMCSSIILSFIVLSLFPRFSFYQFYQISVFLLPIPALIISPVFFLYHVIASGVVEKMAGIIEWDEWERLNPNRVLLEAKSQVL